MKAYQAAVGSPKGFAAIERGRGCGGEAGGRGGQGADMAKNKTAAMRAVVTAAHRGAELRCR